MSSKMDRQKEIEDQLENLVDDETLEMVLDSLQSICYGKAEHLETNWQDKNAARAWQVCGNWIGKASAKAYHYNI